MRRPLSDLYTATDLRPSGLCSAWARIAESIAVTQNLIIDFGELSPGRGRAVAEFARWCRAVADSLDHYAAGHVDADAADADAGDLASPE
jgi:hypothetical protein